MKLVDQIKELTDIGKLDLVISAALTRKAYLEADDFGKLIIDLLQLVDMGNSIVLRKFIRKGDSYVVDNSADLLDDDMAHVGYANDRPINSLIPCLGDPAAEELWSLVQKVYDDCRLEEDLKMLNTGDFEDNVLYSLVYLEEDDHTLYFEIV